MSDRTAIIFPLHHTYSVTLHISHNGSRTMEFVNSRTGDRLTTYCDGNCICHEMFGANVRKENGCCCECGCPIDSDGWDYLTRARDDAHAEALMRKYGASLDEIRHEG